MALHGKKHLAAENKLEALNKKLTIKEALSAVKDLAYAKFDESVDLNIILGIDPSKADQAVKGSVLLPAGVGKKVRVIAFAKGKHADDATKAGADFVGTNDLVEKISSGWLDFDYVVATPDMMGLVGKLAKILGPRDLLPNAKNGTVTFDIDKIVVDLKKGRSFYKNNKSGAINFSIGKSSFDVNKLYDNFVAFIKTLQASKPASSKGQFLRKVTISSTMGVGIGIDLDELSKI